MEFFQSQPTIATVSIDGKELTALECAKIIAFQDRHFCGFDRDGWVSVDTAKNAIANFFLGESDELRPKREEFYNKFTRYEDAFSSTEYNVLGKACDIIEEWRKLKLYTCFNKADDEGTRTVNVSKLQALLGLDFPQEAIDRLEALEVGKDGDGDWIFNNVFGRSFYDTATEGLLYEVRHAINLQKSLTYHVNNAIRDGYTTFEEVCSRMGLREQRLTLADKLFMQDIIINTDITPEEYTVFYTTHNDFMAKPSETAEAHYSFVEAIKTFKTKRESTEFALKIGDAYNVQKRRNNIARQIAELEKQLAELNGKLDDMVK
jgi:hypothetical protein